MYKKIPTYKISADELNEDIDAIASTSRPAIMIKGVKLSAQDAPRPAVLTFAEDKERKVIAGPAMIPDMEIYRNDEMGEYNVQFSAEVIATLVEKFARKNVSNFNVEHNEKKEAPLFVMEHWIVEDPEMDKSRTFGFTDLPKGTWFIMAKCTDDKYWENEIKKQDKTGFSIEGILGLKLTKINMKKEFKNVKRFSAIKKFEEVEGVTPEDAVVTVAADEIAVDAPVTVVDENLDVVEDYSGEVLIEGDVVNITDGVITSVEPVEEPVTEDEAPVEAAVEDEVPAEEVPAEEVPEATTEEVEAVGLDEAAVLAIIQPKLDEIYAAIAAMQVEAEAPDEEAPVMMSKLDRKVQALSLMSNYLK